MEKRNLFCVGILLLTSTIVLTYYGWGRNHDEVEAGKSNPSVVSNVEQDIIPTIDTKAVQQEESHDGTTMANQPEDMEEQEPLQTEEPIDEDKKTGIVNTNALNVRSAPLKDAEVLWILEEEDEVDILEDSSSGWYHIQRDGMSGYVYAEYITIE